MDLYGDLDDDSGDEIQFGDSMSMDGSMSLSLSGKPKGGGLADASDPCVHLCQPLPRTSFPTPSATQAPLKKPPCFRYNFDISGGPMKGAPPFAFSMGGGLGGSSKASSKRSKKATPYTSKSLNFGEEGGGLRRSRDRWDGCVVGLAAKRAWR